MKSSSKIIMITALTLLVVVALDLLKSVSLLNKAAFVLSTGLLCVIFQFIENYYNKNPLKLPRSMQRLVLGKDILREIDKIDDFSINPIDNALERFDRRVKESLLNAEEVKVDIFKARQAVSAICSQIDAIELDSLKEVRAND